MSIIISIILFKFVVVLSFKFGDDTETQTQLVYTSYH